MCGIFSGGSDTVVAARPANYMGEPKRDRLEFRRVPSGSNSSSSTGSHSSRKQLIRQGAPMGRARSTNGGKKYWSREPEMMHQGYSPRVAIHPGLFQPQPNVDPGFRQFGGQVQAGPGGHFQASPGGQFQGGPAGPAIPRQHAQDFGGPRAPMPPQMTPHYAGRPRHDGMYGGGRGPQGMGRPTSPNSYASDDESDYNPPPYGTHRQGGYPNAPPPPPMHHPMPGDF
ncbi:MAG: hypothetical protein M1825_000512 [Sarcosagium campestre]|nr:MAG: hypothetical protein M1825_000512 [Sarcosagium campestre]